MELDYSFMDFNFFDVAQNSCFSVLNIALSNLDLYGFDVNCQDKDGNTLLHYIAAKGNLETINKLLHLKAYTNILNAKCETPLHLACLGGHLNITKVLLEHKANVNAVDCRGETPIFKAVKSGNPALCSFLIGKGANVKLVNRNDENLLHLAAKFGDKRLAQALLRLGVHTDAVTKYGEDVISLALRAYSEETLDFLMQQPNVDLHRVYHKRSTLLHLAVQLNHKKACESLLNHKIDINAQDDYGITPLHLATELCLLDIINLLLKHGAHVNAQDCDGYTALHLAAAVPTKNSNNLQEVIHSLLRHGADPEIVTCHGDLALHCAAACGSASAVVMLFKRHLVNCRNYSGLTPEDRALATGKEVIVMLLQSLNNNLVSFDTDGEDHDHFDESAISEIICNGNGVNNNNTFVYDDGKSKELNSKTLIPILRRRSELLSKSFRNK